MGAIVIAESTFATLSAPNGAIAVPLPITDHAGATGRLHSQGTPPIVCTCALMPELVAQRRHQDYLGDLSFFMSYIQPSAFL
jgi:hypothetical protein